MEVFNQEEHTCEIERLHKKAVAVWREKKKFLETMAKS
jgi:hypothetical protein